MEFGPPVIFVLVFASLKIFTGLRSWWHVTLGVSTACLIWLAFVWHSAAGSRSAPALRLGSVGLAMLALVSFIKVARYIQSDKHVSSSLSK